MAHAHAAAAGHDWRAAREKQIAQATTLAAQRSRWLHPLGRLAADLKKPGSRSSGN